MSYDFTAALRRAARQSQTGRLMQATRTIQAALGAAGLTQSDLKKGPAAAPTRRKAGQTLGPVLEKLRTLKAARPSAATRAAPAPTLPPGTQFLSRTHTVKAGSRDYRLFVPDLAAGPARGLIVMLHGCTQTPEDFAAGTQMNAVAAKERLILVWPQQRAQHNAQSCWNWFNPADQKRGSGEAAILATLARAVGAEFAVGPKRTFVAGLSAGGAMAAVLGAAYPDVFVGIGVHSGLAAGAARDVMGAFAAMRGTGLAPQPPARPVATIVFQGTADATVNALNAEAVLAGAGVASAPSRVVQFTTGSRSHTRRIFDAGPGSARAEAWTIKGAGHAWSGGSAAGSYADPAGPDASAEMVRFFLNVRKG